MTSMRSLILVLTGVVVTQTSLTMRRQEADSLITAGRMQPIRLDGSFDTLEWSGATTLGSGEIRVALGVAGADLQVGLMTPALYVASLCISRGDTIRILHASAALGRATYVRQGEVWRLTEGFEWRVRRTDTSEAANRERAGHRATFGWVANTAPMGRPGETEIRVDTSLVSGRSVHIAAGFMMSSEETTGWPTSDSDDACMSRQVIAGPPPQQAMFRPSRWPRLLLTADRR